MIFVTVGSMFPFDRLIRAIDGLAAAGAFGQPVRAQIGDGSYEPRSMPFDRFLDKAGFDELMRGADAVISHAGIGTISTALAYGKPLLVLPRRKEFGEHVNDHQVPTARTYAARGHVLMAEREADIEGLLPALYSFSPQPRVVNSRGVAERIARFIEEQGL